MALTAFLELEFKPETLGEGRALMDRVLKETRAFDGCLGIEVLADRSNEAHWVVVEKWESEQHDAAYREFRAGPGAITELGPLLAGAPKLTYFDEV